MKTLIFATHNQNKLREVREMVAPLGINVIGGDEAGLADVDETGTTFEENALLKARAGFAQTGQMVLAEDAGFCIEALNGSPGVYSARFAQKHGGYPAVFDVVNNEMGDCENRNACFVSVMVIMTDENTYHTFNGYFKGTVIKTPRGENGFGYDPIFVPTGMDKTVAELSSDEKNALSHRSQSLKQVLDFLKNI